MFLILLHYMVISFLNLHELKKDNVANNNNNNNNNNHHHHIIIVYFTIGLYLLYVTDHFKSQYNIIFLTIIV